MKLLILLLSLTLCPIAEACSGCVFHNKLEAAETEEEKRLLWIEYNHDCWVDEVNRLEERIRHLEDTGLPDEWKRCYFCWGFFHRDKLISVNYGNAHICPMCKILNDCRGKELTDEENEQVIKDLSDAIVNMR